MKPVRIALAIFFSLLVAFLVTVAVIFLRTDPKKIFSYFSEQIASSVFLQLKAESVKFDILKGIELSNVQVIDVQTSKSNLLATFDRGSILYNPISLLWSRMDILGASVSGFRTTFDDLMRTVSNINEIIIRSSNQDTPLGVVIRSIAVENSELVFSGTIFSVKGKILFAELLGDSVINADLDSKYGFIGVRGNLNTLSINLKELQVGKILGLSDVIVLNNVRGKAVRESDTLYYLSGDQADITYMTYKGSAIGAFSGKFDIAGNELSLSGFDMQTGKSRFHMDEFKTSTVIQDLTIRLGNITAELSDLLPGFEGTATGDFCVRADTTVRFGGDLVLTNLNYAVVRQTWGRLHVTNNAFETELYGKCAGGDFRADASCGDIFGGTVDVKITQDRFDAEKLLQPQEKKNTQQAETNATNGAFPLTNAVNVSYSVGSVRYKKFATGKADIRVSVTGRGVRVEELRADFLKGTLLAKGIYADDAFTGEASLADGKMKEFTALFLDSGKKLYGTASGKAKFRINMKDPYLSSGDISLSVRDGEIKDVFIQGRVSAVLFDIPLDDIFFDSISLNGKMENGQLVVNVLNFESENIRLGASGNVRLKTLELALRSEISFSKDYLSGLPNVAQIFTSGYEKDERIAFGIAVNGPAKDPVVKIEKTK